MITTYKANTVLSIANISIFIIELLLIAITDFSDNRGTSKEVALLSFVFLYFWLTIPSLVTLALSRYRKKGMKMDLVFFLVNTAIFIYNLPMFFSYLKSL